MQGGHLLVFLYMAAPTRRTAAYMAQVGSGRMPDEKNRHGFIVLWCWVSLRRCWVSITQGSNRMSDK